VRTAKYTWSQTIEEVIVSIPVRIMYCSAMSCSRRCAGAARNQSERDRLRSETAKLEGVSAGGFPLPQSLMDVLFVLCFAGWLERSSGTG
jgi:hypothetical protein